jgi:hypothetical protein
VVFSDARFGGLSATGWVGDGEGRNVVRSTAFGRLPSRETDLLPEVISIDGHLSCASSHVNVRDWPSGTKVRSEDRPFTTVMEAVVLQVLVTMS